MTIFERLLRITQKRENPAKEYHKYYHELRWLSLILLEILIPLRKYHQQLIKQQQQKGLTFVGYSGFSKTAVIWDKDHRDDGLREGLIPELIRVANNCKLKLKKGEEEQKEVVGFTPDELLDIIKSKEKLEEVYSLTVDLEKIKKLDTTKEKLSTIENSFKAIRDLLKEFHDQEKNGLEKKVLRDLHEISLVRKVLNRSRLFYYCTNDHDIKKEKSECPVCKKKIEYLWEYKLTKKDLNEFRREADFLNSHNSPENKVVWRRWWRNKQLTELDIGTGYPKEHINVDVRLKNQGEKNIHLLVA